MFLNACVFITAYFYFTKTAYAPKIRALYISTNAYDSGFEMMI